MNAALEEAGKAAGSGEIPVGAVTVFENEILVRSHNLVEHLRDASAHAEMLVLKKTAAVLDRWRLTGVTLVVTVEPCPMCAMAMVLFRIDRLIYGCSEPRTGACGSLLNLPGNPALNHRIEVVPGILAEKSGKYLKDFFELRRA
ncbi:nucleoside deaminase [bacterium]|nr:nucleoside deaminase [candidate division CSSED10-310 bacterium]